MPQMLRQLCILFSILTVQLLPGVLQAQYFETGLSFSPSYRFEDRSTRSVDKFRTSVSFNPLRTVEADQPDVFLNTEFFFRFSGFIGDSFKHYAGFGIGRYAIPSFGVSEFKSNGSFFISDWRYDLTYLILTYHYRGSSLPGMRKWQWELGGGFGLVPSALWKIRGIRQTRFSLSEFNTTHRARSGTIARLEPALVRNTGAFFFRFGLRFEYVLLGGWKGNSSGDSSDWYVLKDNSLVLEPDFIEVNRIVNENNFFDPVIASTGFVRERARHTFATTQIVIGAGIRF